MRALCAIYLLLGAGLFAQCGTGPAVRATYPLASGDDVAVVYRDGPAVLALQNDSSPSAGQAGIGDGAMAVAAKTTSDDYLRGLLSRWEDLGFFAAAQQDAHPQAKASLTLVRNGRRHVCSRLPLAMSSVEEIERFNAWAGAFRTVYDHTQSYQPASLKADDLYRENQRLLENAREAMAREASGRGRK